MRRKIQRFPLYFCAIAITLLAGCTDQFLNKHTARTANTLTDIMFQQIMDNIAMFCCESETLPHFAIIGDGSTQLADTAIANPSLGWEFAKLKSIGLGFNGQHQLVENWKLQPVMSAGRLQRMRSAFHYVVCPIAYDLTLENDGKFKINDDPCSPFLAEMIKMGLLPSPQNYITSNEPCAVTVGADGITFSHSEDAQAYLPNLQAALNCNFPTGWFGCGSKREAPFKCARIGAYSGHRAWINSCSISQLSRFTTTILALAAQDPSPEPGVTIVRRIGNEDSDEAYQVTWTLPASKVGLKLPRQLNPCPATATVAQFDELHQHLEKIEAFIPEIATEKWIAKSRQTGELGALKHTLTEAKNGKSQEQKRSINSAIQTIDGIEGTLIPRITAPSAFDRSGNSPFSRGGAGVEYVPTVIP